MFLASNVFEIFSTDCCITFPRSILRQRVFCLHRWPRPYGLLFFSTSTWNLTYGLHFNYGQQTILTFCGGKGFFNLCEINLEEAYSRIKFLNDAKSYETYCGQLERLIYNYKRNNNGNSIDLKLIRETQQIIIRSARKSSQLISEELKHYLKQILENVKQQPTEEIPSPS
ncbi:hypothetical protein NPIL_141791 [Nephila pilipes]|uniref:Uncharacterized protein n=1 Tax=Nephila pilipes TaxID=299642 RepID=A0A8X6MD09_NEPPI|nr:hypothetical protein NPIL_141791 [Nephila pilipes]